MNGPVEDIKKRIDIVDFIGSFISLKKAGRNFKALCPFHQERSASFVVSPERQIWHCFGACAEGGDIFKFLMKWENITFSEALKELAEKAGVKLQRLAFEDKVWKKKERLIQLNTLAAEYFHFVLFQTNFGKKALNYLNSRNINPKIAKKFQLGYSPSSWDSLLSFLKKKNYEMNEISESGLVVRGERGSYYDRFRGRLIFPIKDVRGNVIGFSGRSLDKEEKSAKYINTPETPIYHKRESLYGVDLTKEAIKKEKNVYLVEGEFDVITPYQHRIENIVAIKGSAVTREQLMFIKRYTNRITLALDADNTGEDAIRRGIEDAESLDFEIEVVYFDFAKDPDEAVRKDISKFKKALRERVSVYDFIIQTAQKKYPGDDPFNKKKIGDMVIPFIERVNNPIVQSHYIKKLADILNVSEKSILILIRNIKQKKKQQQFFKINKKKVEEEARELNIQKYVLSMLFQSDNPYRTSNKLFSIVEINDFSVPSYKELLSIFLDFKAKNPKEFDTKKYVANLNPQLQSVFDELYLYASYEADFEDVNLEKLFYEIKKNSLKRQIKEKTLAQEISQVDEAVLKRLSLSLKEVEKNLLAL